MDPETLCTVALIKFVTCKGGMKLIRIVTASFEIIPLR